MNQESIFDEEASAYCFLAKSTQEALRAWIEMVMVPSKTISPHSSHGLAQMFSEDSGLEISNGEMKGAMLGCGYKPTKFGKRYWHYHIKRSSNFNQWSHQHRFHLNGQRIFCFCHCADEEIAHFRALCRESSLARTRA